MRPSSGSRLPGIEGLRAIAACSILVLHTWLYSAPGNTDLGRVNRIMPDLAFGVILFFTLSGFLLYRPFAAAILRGRRLPSIVRYFRNRALRILPAYWVILLFCATVLGGLVLWDRAGNLTEGRLLNADLLGRAAFFVQDYSPSTLLVGIGPAWSLAVEVVFYCVLPLLALLAATLARGRPSRSARRLAAFAPALLLLAVGLTGKFVALDLLPPSGPYEDWSRDWHSVVVRSFLGQADLFTFGMVLAVLRVEFEDGTLHLPRWWRKGAIVGALAAYVIVVIHGENRAGWQNSYSPANTMIAAACALVLALVVLPASAPRGSRLVRILDARPFVAVGIVSYSIFLWHEPLIRSLHAHGLTFSGPVGFVANLLVAAALTGALSAITYRFVEAPALRLRFRRSRDAAAPVPASQLEAAP